MVMGRKRYASTHLNMTEDELTAQAKMLGSCLNTEAALVLRYPFLFGFACSESVSSDGCSSACDDSGLKSPLQVAMQGLAVASRLVAFDYLT